MADPSPEMLAPLEAQFNAHPAIQAFLRAGRPNIMGWMRAVSQAARDTGVQIPHDYQPSVQGGQVKFEKKSFIDRNGWFLPAMAVGAPILAGAALGAFGAAGAAGAVGGGAGGSTLTTAAVPGVLTGGGVGVGETAAVTGLAGSGFGGSAGAAIAGGASGGASGVGNGVLSSFGGYGGVAKMGLGVASGMLQGAAAGREADENRRLLREGNAQNAAQDHEQNLITRAELDAKQREDDYQTTRRANYMQEYAPPAGFDLPEKPFGTNMMTGMDELERQAMVRMMQTPKPLPTLTQYRPGT